ncbi:MAG TPA: hypothetical protein VM779_13325 [Thermoanaerobaculia bacterium]|nr:hypothetical protein [Thermoanaerobaculia bacterium]
MSTLVRYLSQRSDSAAFVLPTELGRTLDELFSHAVHLLPQPYAIHPADETQPALLGFPVAESHAMRDLELKLDRWLNDEVAWHVGRDAEAKEKAQGSFSSYSAHLMRLAENAMMSNLLSDYHAVFWLAHSLDLARHFTTIPRRVSALDSAVGRTQGDALKYRIYSKWATETRELMTQVAARSSTILDGEEQRALQFFRLLQDDVLLLTEEFIGPDLRELRSFVTGYLRRDFQAFRDSFERLRTTSADLIQRDRTLKTVIPLFSPNHENGMTIGLLLDSRFQHVLFEHPAVQNVMSREDREQFQLLSRRVREFGVLNQLRRGIVWMTGSAEGEVLSADRRDAVVFARSTRPIDFGRPGVVDPMVHRFGLIYDISNFTETLGNIRRGGEREEIRSYRQMLLFQRRVESIAQRHRLQFEKFLGDGGFYTTTRALHLVRGAVEIQRFYSEMKRKGFSFNRGMRIALNYGYYRLLPMKVASDSAERITEFYGPGIVELSRLTTGKANKEIEEIASFLVTHGYDPGKVQQFFAPLARGVDVIDHAQHQREYYAYLNQNGHLVNEGIVASRDFLSELSNELHAEAQPLFRLRSPWGGYLGFAPAIPGLEYIGLRLLGMVSLKGLDKIEIGEIVPFAQGEVEASPVDGTESLLNILRQDFHAHPDAPLTGAFDEMQRAVTTNEHVVGSEIILCMKAISGAQDEVLIGEWDPLSDDVHRPLRIPHGDFERLFSLKGELTPDLLMMKKESVRELYLRLSDNRNFEPAIQLSEYRTTDEYIAYILGDVVDIL